MELSLTPVNHLSISKQMCLEKCYQIVINSTKKVPKTQYLCGFSGQQSLFEFLGG